eukprot:TRINITY_DN14944_c0_g3_i1.p1 TRINITY_DN14944_c0_g3~~TRINITY_DN14944_c0_g3_i1.p1  ORF type:complete len:503 (+),score=97.06 TRINITY_DN14944_c0_g3_i1:44-1510(+)
MAPGPVKGQLSTVRPDGRSQGGSGGRGASKDCAQAPVNLSSIYEGSTVGASIAIALRKELLNQWASVEPNALNVVVVDTIVATVITGLRERLFETANLRFPGLNADASVPLPAAPVWPAVGALGSAKAAAELAELHEEFQGVLGSLDLVGSNVCPGGRDALAKEVAAQLPASHPWQRWLCGSCAFLLPAAAVLGICWVAAPAILARRWSGQNSAEEVDGTGAGEGSSGSGAEEVQDGDAVGALYDKESLPAGAPQGLARALRCRRRVFALERELTKREQAEREREAFERQEREKSEARLMDVNRQLEERLKARTEELRRAGQKIIEAQRSVDDARTQLTERKREIAQLKYQLEQDTELRREAQIREQEHTRSLLRTAARDHAIREATRKRVEQLKKCVHEDAKATAMLLEEQEAEADHSPTMIDQVEAEFAVSIQRRKEQYDAALDDFQHKIEKKRQEYNEINRRLKETNAAYYARAGVLGLYMPPQS